MCACMRSLIGVVVEFSPVSYTVDEGDTANLRIVLIGLSELDVMITMVTRDLTANGEQLLITSVY